MRRDNRKTMGRIIDKDVVLCTTTNARAQAMARGILLEDQIPFRESFEKIPFYKRELYKGAKEICVIFTHRNQYMRARKRLESLDLFYRKKLMLNTI